MKDPRKIIQPRGGAKFCQTPREFGINVYLGEVGILKKKTDFDGRKMIVNLSMSKHDDIPEQYLVSFAKGSEIAADSVYTYHSTMF